jgi:hypothetical protein
MLSGHAFGAVQYQATAVVALPYTATDPGSGAQATYTSVSSVNTTSTAEMPDGSYTSVIAGGLSGTTTTGGYTQSSAYAYDPINGFRFVGEYFPSITGAHSNTSVAGANPVLGQVIGTSAINSSAATDTNGLFGQDAWVSTKVGNTQSLGLTGANFGYTQTSNLSTGTAPVVVTMTHRSSTASFINASGQVAGTTSRFVGDASATASGATNSTSLGTSAYLYTPGSTPTEIGLMGTNYSYNVAATSGGTIAGSFYSNSLVALNSTGEVIGTATPYYDSSAPGTGTNTEGTSLGKDGWVSIAGTATPVGLYQAGSDPTGLSSGFHYYGNPSTSASNNSGTVPGTPGYGAVGSNASESSARSTSMIGVNTAGVAIGYSSIYGSTGAFVGQDSFEYIPTGTTTGVYQQLGYYSGAPLVATAGTASSSYVSASGARSSTPFAINTSGQVAGTSSLYGVTAGGTSTTSTIAYLSSPATTTIAGTPTRVGLFGQAGDADAGSTAFTHVNSNLGSSSTITDLTDSGLVGGYSTRYIYNTTTSEGQDAWVYDSKTQTTYTVDPTDAANAAYTYSQIYYLSEDGYAVGRYEAANASVYHSFIWSEAGGFEDLNANTTGLTAAGYQNLILGFYDGGAGSSVYSTASTTASGSSNGLFALTAAVPEPTGLSFLGLGVAGLLRRRRTV